MSFGGDPQLMWLTYLLEAPSQSGSPPGDPQLMWFTSCGP